ncbi:hypothetical protein CANARDRAFT_194422, partial [[Candida] arabinofermentans NRRL YB-2248]
VTSPAILAGAFFFASGFVQIVCGIWTMIDNNVYGSVVFLSFDRFFMSLGGIVSDILNVSSQYKSTEEYNNALGIYYASWTVVTFILWTATFKGTLPIFIFNQNVFIFMMLYTIATFSNRESIKVAAGVFCFLSSFSGYYALYDGLHFAANSYTPLPESKWFRMPGSWDIHVFLRGIPLG